MVAKNQDQAYSETDSMLQKLLLCRFLGSCVSRINGSVRIMMFASQKRNLGLYTVNDDVRRCHPLTIPLKYCANSDAGVKGDEIRKKKLRNSSYQDGGILGYDDSVHNMTKSMERLEKFSRGFEARV